MFRARMLVGAAVLVMTAIAGTPLVHSAAAEAATSSPHLPASCHVPSPAPTQVPDVYECSFTAPTAEPLAQGSSTSTRTYWLHLPSGGNPGDLPLVVYLHGCTQTGLDAAYGTKWDALADRDNFIVVYPQQNATSNSSAPFADGNGTACWNWFLPEDQQRGSGEPLILSGLTQEVIAAEQVDPSRVYVEGASAGADMSVILAATYPEIYAAYGAIAGCAYATCSDATGAQTVAAMADRARVVPGFVEQGTADTLNAYPLGQGLVESWLQADNTIEQRTGGSVSLQPVNVTENDVAAPDPTDPSNQACEPRSATFPCPGGVVGFRGSYPSTREQYADSANCDVLDYWIIHGLEHAYPDGTRGPDDPTYGPMGTFTDPLGPDVTAAAWAFFQAHPKGSCARLDPTASLPESSWPAGLVVAGLIGLVAMIWWTRRRQVAHD